MTSDKNIDKTCIIFTFLLRQKRTVDLGVIIIFQIITVEISRDCVMVGNIEEKMDTSNSFSVKTYLIKFCKMTENAMSEHII